MSIKSRIEKLEHQAAPYDMPPFAIKQDAPGAPVRFYLNGEPVEMSADEVRRRWPDAIFMTWSHQPWAGEL